MVPLAFILHMFLGVTGIYVEEPIADVQSVIATSILFTITVKRVLRNMGEDGIM